MHILTFDRLSRSLVLVGILLLALGLMIAFFKAHRGYSSDGLTLWICVILTIFGLAAVMCLTNKGANVSIAGLLFQIAGIGVAIYALQDIRTKLDQPGLIPTLTAAIESPFKGQSVATAGVAHVQESADAVEASGTLSTHPKSLSTEDRFTVLEDQVSRLEAMHATDIATIRRTIRESQEISSGYHQEQVAAVKDLRKLITDLQTGGLPLTLFGLIWLLTGALLTSVPDVIANWIQHLHW